MTLGALGNFSEETKCETALAYKHESIGIDNMYKVVYDNTSVQ